MLGTLLYVLWEGDSSLICVKTGLLMMALRELIPGLGCAWGSGLGGSLLWMEILLFFMLVIIFLTIYYLQIQQSIEYYSSNLLLKIIIILVMKAFSITFFLFLILPACQQAVSCISPLCSIPLSAGCANGICQCLANRIFDCSYVASSLPEGTHTVAPVTNVTLFYILDSTQNENL